MKKIIKIEVEVDESTEDKLIEHELSKFLDKIKNFCQFSFWKGSKAKITIENE